MNDLIDSLAEDFSMIFADQLGIDSPPDSYVDALDEVLGSDPSKEDALEVLRKRIPDLVAELSECFERDFSNKLVRETFRQGLIGYYGESFDD